MQHPKVGDVVVYSAFGRKLNSIVLAARTSEPSHLGVDGEPILTLAFIDPERETGLSKDKEGNVLYPAGRFPQVQVEYDVVHASHEFSEEFFKEKKIATPTPAIIASHRGHGEWTEYAGDASTLVDELRTKLGLATGNLAAAKDEAARQKSRADLATSVADDLKKRLEDLQAQQGEISH